MKSLLTHQEIDITSKKEMTELKLKNQSICKSIKVFDHQSLATYTYFYDLKEAIEDAKDKFIYEFGADVNPSQVNFDRFIIIKDDEEFSFDFCEFKKESGGWNNGATYASDEDAVKIFNEEISAKEIDLNYLTEHGPCESEEI